MKAVWIGLLILIGLQLEAQDQNTDLSLEFRAVNNYVEYLNKSVHGLFVIHKLLEIENQEINKFVDLESHDLYNITNSDVSSNVFTENSFYEKQINQSQSNPYELAEISQSESKALPQQLADRWNSKTRSIKKILDETNNVRFEINDYLANKDLTDRTQVYGAYEILEKARKLILSFYTQQSDFYRDLEKYSNYKAEKTDLTSLFDVLKDMHEKSRLILDALRFKNDNSFESLTNELRDALKRYQSLSKKYATDLKYARLSINENLKHIDRKVKSVISAAEEFTNSGTVPDRYRLYGKYYHYHNNEIVTEMDWFGSGFINEMNEIIEKTNSNRIKYLEIPLFFQVIYPMKMDTVDHIQSTDPLIEKIPRQLKNREIVESNYTILADSAIVKLKLFDHLIQDGDIVSINFNGDWILEKHSIEKKSKELTLKLNPNGKNFLLLHADSEGRRPPNTMGIRYTYLGETKELELRSDMNTSEVIEIIKPN